MAYPDLECRPSSSPVHRSTCSWRSHGMRTASWSAGGERAGSPRCCSGPHRSTCAPRPAAPSSPSRHRTSSTRVRREVVVGVEGSAGAETRPRVRLQRRGRDRSAAGGGAGVVRTRPGGLRISLVSDRDEVERATRRSSSRPTWPPGPAGKFPRYGSSRWSSPATPPRSCSGAPGRRGCWSSGAEGAAACATPRSARSAMPWSITPPAR